MPVFPKKSIMKLGRGELPGEVCEILFDLGFQSLLDTCGQSVASRKVNRRGLKFCMWCSVTQDRNTPAISNQETEATHGSI